MKFKKEVITGSGKTVYLLACSQAEIKLLFVMAKTTKRYFPQNFELSQERNRLNGLVRELEKVYGEF